MKVLELYSGIGGMHLALQESNIKGEIIASIDINPTANKVYKHNFPSSRLLNRNIQSLTSSFINELEIETILMSPPCQPFTRNGLKRDVSDARTESFSHILNILPDLNVRYILIENVKGFETSEMRDNLLKALELCKFVYQEFILNPIQLGVPNSRPRYYCIARKEPAKFDFETHPVMETFPHHIETNKICISEILENSINIENYLIPDEVLQKHAMTLDICHPNSERSCCFTKSYGRYVTGTGSVFTNKTKEELDVVYQELQNYRESSKEYLACIKQLKLRFFTPREVCRLMCFPEKFSFPDNVTDKQKYMLLGNSINVKVVSNLLKLLISW